MRQEEQEEQEQGCKESQGTVDRWVLLGGRGGVGGGGEGGLTEPVPRTQTQNPVGPCPRTSVFGPVRRTDSGSLAGLSTGERPTLHARAGGGRCPPGTPPDQMEPAVRRTDQRGSGSGSSARC